MSVKRFLQTLLPFIIILFVLFLELSCSSTSECEGGELLQGLPPYSRPVALALDKDNLLWMGSLGVVSYSGNEFKLYDRLNTRIPDNHIVSIFVDSVNTKWFGTEKGYIYTFSNQGWEILPTPNGPYRDSMNGTYMVSDILEDNNGNIWAIAVNGGIWSYRDKIVTRHYSFPLGEVHYHSLSIDAEGNMHALISYELYTYNGKDWDNATPEVLKKEDIRIFCVSYSSAGDRIYYGTDEGLFIMKGEDLIQFTIDNSGLASNHIYNIEEDSLGNIWISYGNSSNVLTMYDEKDWTNYEGKGQYLREVVYEITDKTWFITSSQGFYRFDGQNWNSLPVLDNDPRLWWRQKSISELSKEDTNNVDIYAVLDNPWDYRGKKIKFTGKLEQGWESASFIDDQGNRLDIWPDYHRETYGDFDDILQMKADPNIPEAEESVYVEFVGFLEYQGYYGHMGMWQYQLFITDIMPLN